MRPGAPHCAGEERVILVGQLALPNMGISGVSSTTNRIGPGHATREPGTSLSYTSVTLLLSRKTVNIGS